MLSFPTDPRPWASGGMPVKRTMGRHGSVVKTILVVVAILIALAIAVVLGAIYYTDNQIRAATSEPIPLPSPLADRESTERSLNEKRKEIVEKLQPGGEPVEVTLEPDEANVFLSSVLPEGWRGSVHVEPAGDPGLVRLRAPVEGKVLAQLIPPEMGTIKSYLNDKVKYANLDITLRIDVGDGVSRVEVVKINHPPALDQGMVRKTLEDVLEKQLAQGGMKIPLESGGTALIGGLKIDSSGFQVKLVPSP